MKKYIKLEKFRDRAKRNERLANLLVLRKQDAEWTRLNKYFWFRWAQVFNQHPELNSFGLSVCPFLTVDDLFNDRKYLISRSAALFEVFRFLRQVKRDVKRPLRVRRFPLTAALANAGFGHLSPGELVLVLLIAGYSLKKDKADTITVSMAASSWKEITRGSSVAIVKGNPLSSRQAMS